MTKNQYEDDECECNREARCIFHCGCVMYRSRSLDSVVEQQMCGTGQKMEPNYVPIIPQKVYNESFSCPAYNDMVAFHAKLRIGGIIENYEKIANKKNLPFEFLNALTDISNAISEYNQIVTERLQLIKAKITESPS